MNPILPNSTERAPRPGGVAGVSSINFDALWQHVIAQFACGPDSVHGPSHWRRVEENGLLIARHSGAIEPVVRLFAVFHDSRREHDGWDDAHGRHGAAFAARLRGKWFDLPDYEFALLEYACTWHTHGRTISDPTIGTCWDADRLDLGRVGKQPDPIYLSTATGRVLASGRADRAASPPPVVAFSFVSLPKEG